MKMHHYLDLGFLRLIRHGRMSDFVFAAKSHPRLKVCKGSASASVALALTHGADRHDDLHLLHNRHEFREIHQNLPFVPTEDFENHYRRKLLVSYFELS